MQEEGWVVCRAFKKRAMNPPRSMTGAWNPMSNTYQDSILAGAAPFKHESSELDGTSAVALLQYSSCLAELPQLESPPLPSHDSHGDSADGCVVGADWKELDRFVASQLSPDEGEHASRGLLPREWSEQAAHAGESEDTTDIVALLLLDDEVRKEDTGLLGSVPSTSACRRKNEVLFRARA